MTKTTDRITLDCDHVIRLLGGAIASIEAGDSKDANRRTALALVELHKLNAESPYDVKVFAERSLDNAMLYEFPPDDPYANLRLPRE